MKTQSNIRILSTIMILCLFFACAKDEKQAASSIKGDWEITAINSIYGDFSGNGFAPDTTIEESGELGTFMFNDDMVEFNFTRNDTIYVGNGAWDIKAKKVNSGFTKVTQFTLDIDTHFQFDVSFEDGTKNSEKKATSATFVEMPDDGYGVLMELFLEKK